MSEFDSYLNALKEQAELNNQWSAQQAQRQIDFQERMSNTAHQREMFDLQAAGLNPVLTANSGASTPNGAMAGNSGDTAAFASMLSTILDTENANARASLMAATRSAGSGYQSNLLQSVLQAFGLRTSQAKGIADTVEELANYFGIDGSSIMAFINGSKFPDLGSNTGKSNIQNFKDNSGTNWKTSSVSSNLLWDSPSGKSKVREDQTFAKLKDAITKAGQKVVKFLFK